MACGGRKAITALDSADDDETFVEAAICGFCTIMAIFLHPNP